VGLRAYRTPRKKGGLRDGLNQALRACGDHSPGANRPAPPPRAPAVRFAGPNTGPIEPSGRMSTGGGTQRAPEVRMTCGKRRKIGNQGKRQPANTETRASLGQGRAPCARGVDYGAPNTEKRPVVDQCAAGACQRPGRAAASGRSTMGGVHPGTHWSGR